MAAMSRRALSLVFVAAVLAASCGARGKKVDSTASLAAPAGSVVVDEVVAIVAGRPITLSEVEIEIRLARAAAGNVDAAFAPISDAERSGMLRHLLDRTAVLRGLKQHYPDTLHPRAAELEVKLIRKSFQSGESWQRFLDRMELTEDEVQERRRRALEAGTILQAKLADTVRIDRSAVDAYLGENPGVEREEAQARLLEQRSGKDLEDILAEARRATSARLLGPSATAPTPLAPATETR